MIVDFSQTLSDFEGKEATWNDKPLTLGIVCANSMNVNNGNEPDDVLARGKLMLRIYGKDEVDITPEEAAMLRKSLANIWTPIIVAQAHEMLSGND